MKNTQHFPHNLLFGFLTLFCSFQTFAYDQAVFDQFEAGLAIPSEAFDEMRKFDFSKQTLPDAYIQSFLPMMKKRVFDEKRKALASLDNRCRENVKVDFLDRLTDSSDPVVADFESGLIRIEVSSCLKATKPMNVISIFSDPAFQKASIQEIVTNGRKGKFICEVTHAATIGDSSYCYEPIIADQGSIAFNHHFNSWNAPKNVADAPVYFRELFATAHQTSNGVAFHLVAYVRGPKIESYKRFIVRSGIKTEQSTSMQLLKDQLP